ncbi:hypothetical protein MRB53_040299 [Persea americana]|nr:hypothetical protein MRB53_040299 [Persea americana]
MTVARASGKNRMASTVAYPLWNVSLILYIRTEDSMLTVMSLTENFSMFVSSTEVDGIANWRSADPAQASKGNSEDTDEATWIRTCSRSQLLDMASPDALFADFAAAYATRDGHRLASTICPEPPAYDPARLYNFRNGINQYSVKTDLQYKLQYNPAIRLDKREAAAWLEIFVAFHKFVGSLLHAEEQQNVNRSMDADWARVYEEWKEVVHLISRGYSNGPFAAWTIPCLYVSGKYLRVFAIKADEALASQRDHGLGFGDLQEEDALDPSSQNEKLEDAARQINRIFGLCSGDR